MDTRQWLRPWQRAAYEEYFRIPRRDFLLVATPGAGKTAYALTVAAELRARREIAAITVVTPTEHLKHQWAAAAGAFGISLDSGFRNAHGAASADFAGVAVTYAQVAARPALHEQRTRGRRTLVIFDEIHHAGDALSWGEAVRTAFEPARRRLALTGTPFRSDTNPIPFVTYTEDTDGVARSASDFVYGYGPALADGVVRPVIFLAYSGEMRWRARVAGDLSEFTATLGAPGTRDQLAQAWRAALDPDGEWVRQVLARRIAQFAGSGDRWMVAVRMVSEGVDIPRLAVGVYATSVSTALFFAQAVGRFARARRRGETASVFLPSVPVLLGHAAELEAERDHVLKRRDDESPDELLAAAQRRTDTPDVVAEPAVQILHASAQFDRVVFDGGEFAAAAGPGSPEEEDFLGLPGLLEPGQVAALLRKRRAGEGQARARDATGTPPERLRGGAPTRMPASAGPGHNGPSGSAPAVRRETLAALRKELNGLVSAWHHRTGQPHGLIHAELRRACGGPPLAQATAEQIRERAAALRRWASAGR